MNNGEDFAFINPTIEKLKNSSYLPNIGTNLDIISQITMSKIIDSEETKVKSPEKNEQENLTSENPLGVIATCEIINSKKEIKEIKFSPVEISLNLEGNVETKKQEKSFKVVDFLLNNKFSTKSANILSRFFISHFLAYILVYIFILIQSKIGVLCFIDTVCNCHNNFLIKLYTFSRSLFLYWGIMFFLGIYTLFSIQYYAKRKFLKKYVILILIIVSSAVYLTLPGENDAFQELIVYLFSFLLTFSFYYYFWRKIKKNWKIFFSKIKFQTIFLILLFSHLIFTKHVLKPFIERIMEIDDKYLARNLNFFIIWIYCLIYKILIKRNILNLGIFALTENIEYNAVLFYCRIGTTFIFSMQWSNIISMNINDWAGWFQIIFHLHFLIEFYFGYNIFNKILKKIKNIIRPNSIEKPNNNKKEIIKYIKHTFSGVIIDMECIIVPRILFIFYVKKWIEYHGDIFTKNCELDINNNFPFNENNLNILVIVNLLFIFFIIVYMIKTKKNIIEYRFFNLSILHLTYRNLLFHVYFELIFQDFLTQKHA